MSRDAATFSSTPYFVDRGRYGTAEPLNYHIAVSQIFFDPSRISDQTGERIVEHLQY